VWVDKDDLRPGAFKPQIEKAIARSRYFIICLSHACLHKLGDNPGFQDSELTHAVQIAARVTEQEFVIVPVRFEETERGDHRISIYQQYDLFPIWGETIEKLVGLFGGGKENSKRPTMHEALISKVAILYGTKAYDRALDMVEALEEIEGQTLQSMNARGSILHGTNRLQDALDHFCTSLVFPRQSGSPG
jgi:hypothetical protein